MLKKYTRYRFLFEELVKRDFKKKYKRTVLGMLWSVLSPLLMLLVMRLVFTHFFGRHIEHYTTFLFCGNLVYTYFNESTSQGMMSLMGNASIFTKVNVPKYLFLFSKNVQTLINFGITLCVFFAFCIIDNITFTWKLILLVYPIVLLLLFNIGVGLILSALFVFFLRHPVPVDRVSAAADVYVRHLLLHRHLRAYDPEPVPAEPHVPLYPLFPEDRHRGHHPQRVVPSADAGGRGHRAGAGLPDL